MRTLQLHSARRFELSAQAAFWWMSGKRLLHSSMGVTRNISNSRVLIGASECSPVGAAIQVAVLLPQNEGSGYGIKL